LNPIDFVPLAEESDLIVRLGSHVLLRAAHEAARWHRELPREEHPLFVSVNISSRQIFRQNLIQEIRHILGRNIVPKGTLRLEITESLVMENPEQATEILEWLRGAGADLALDDFGTGYSSLAYLQRFPFDTIKIDKALVQQRGASNGAGSAIVRSIVALGHELGKKVVAEGVEMPEDVSFLRSIGCQYAQGFYYGEPMSDRDVLQLLKMVRTAESKLRPRGFFRAKTKAKQKEQKAAKRLIQRAASSEAAARANGGALPAPESAADAAAAGNGILTNATVRTRSRPEPEQPAPNGDQPSPAEVSSRPPSPNGAPPQSGGFFGQAAAPNGPPPPPVEFADQPPPNAAPEPPPGLPPAVAPLISGLPPPLASGPPLPLLSEPLQSPDSMPPLAAQQPPPPPPPLPMLPQSSGMSEAKSPLDALKQLEANPVWPAPPASLPIPQATVPPATASPAVPKAPSAPGNNQPPLDTEAMAAALRQQTTQPEAPPAAAVPPARPRAHAASTAKRPPRRPAPAKRPVPDFSGLPPAMAQSLARLAGVPWPPPPDGETQDERQLEEEGSGGNGRRDR